MCTERTRGKSESVTAKPQLLVNLGLAIAAAVASGFVALRLRQSVLAGVIIEPYTTGFVDEADAVQELAEIGVTLLMFSVGLEVSSKDVLRSGPVALVGANLQVAILIGLGYLVGIADGWWLGPEACSSSPALEVSIPS